MYLAPTAIAEELTSQFSPFTRGTLSLILVVGIFSSLLISLEGCQPHFTAQTVVGAPVPCDQPSFFCGDLYPLPLGAESTPVRHLRFWPRKVPYFAPPPLSLSKFSRGYVSGDPT